jgi:natural product precursor
MKKFFKLKLNQLSKAELKVRQMNALKGGGIVRLSLFFGFTCSFFSTDCTDPNKTAAVETRVDSIVFVNNQQEDLELKLSDIADSIKYVALETNQNSLIQYVNRLTVTPEYILVEDGCGLLLFSRQGKFISSVGRKGNGPDEYICLGGYDIDVNKRQIHVFSIYAYCFLSYDFSGDFLGKFQLPGILKDRLIDKFLLVGDGKMLATQTRKFADPSDTTFLINLNTGNYEAFEGKICGVDRSNGTEVYLRKTSKDCDSIFCFTDKPVFKCVVYQDKPGKEEERDFFMPQFLFEAGDVTYLMGNCQQEAYKYESERSHTTQKGKTVHYMNTKHYPYQPWIYQIQKRKFCMLEHYGDKIQGIKNNMDGGFPFFTRTDAINGAIPEIEQDKLMVTFFLPEEFIKDQDMHKISDSSLYVDAGQKLRNLTDKLQEDDNPVLMILHLKKDTKKIKL